MACMKLGSKPEAFHLDGQTLLCSTGLPSDVIIEVGEMSFHLHKFPLLSRSGVIENLIGESCGEDERNRVLQLHDIPGGAKTFLLVAKFCYGVKIELTALNVVSLRCAAEHLQMNENFGEGNLVSQTENFLNEVFGDWTDSLKALEACEEVLPHAEELHIVSRCINSLAVKAIADPTLVSWPESGGEAVQSPVGTVLWNGIRTLSNPHTISDDWWYEDVSCLKLPMYKRLILAVESRGMRPERISGSLMYYAKKYLPLMGRQSSFQNGNRAAAGSTVSALSDADQRNLLEEIVELLPDQKGVTSAKFLLRLLRTSMLLHASPSCRENLEKQIGAQLDQAVLEDLLIPNLGYSVETLYDIDCVQRILDHFMLVDRDVTDSTNCIVDEAQLMVGSHSLTRMTMVANLVDGYLAEVAPDVNLKLQKFQSLAAVIPDYARPLDDGIYRAIDIYLKAHPWLTDSERELICRLVNCQKLSLEASTHAAQNERLPLRLIVQVLFFEQLRLRTSIAGWFFVSDNLETSQDPSGNLALPRGSTTQDEIVAVDDMRERVSELEKECLSMKQEIEKLVKTKRSWNIFCRRLGFRLKPNSWGPKASNNAKASPSSTTPLLNTNQNQQW
ncbi:hypothetical protein PVL29_016875 [Vitis rotundifolia]|uniref:BTB/POZ domain-containing protein n=3 Tax=Vitis rotundifolia TaxID=103349 RepID=A0AA39DH27_VITRO|nr:hypothetical protein PVL29_016875 [Vitis rotundifolia]